MRRLLIALAALVVLAHPVHAGFYDLLDAARANDTALAARLLAEGTEPDGSPSGFPDSYSPLQWAAYHGNTKLIALLLEAGADTERRDFNGDRALLWAARAGQAEALRALIAAGSPVDSTADPYGVSPLMLAVFSATPAAVKVLIAAGADIDARDQGGGTALHEAALIQHPGIVRILLASGADPNIATDILGETPLHIAAARADAAIVALLLAAGADPTPFDSDGRAALHIAAFRGIPHNVAALLAAGADPAQPDGAGRLALAAAIDGKSFEWRDNDAAAALLASVTPGAGAFLAQAAAAAMPRTSLLILDLGGNPNAGGVLAASARLKATALLDALIDKGADLARFGPEALSAAASSGSIAAATRLLALGVPIDAPHAGLPPVHVAAEAGQLDMLRLLLERGARPVPPEVIRLSALPLDILKAPATRSAAIDWSLIEARAAWEHLRARQLEARAILAAAIAAP